MQDATTAENRLYISYPSEVSYATEVYQAFLDVLKHEQRIRDFGPRKAFPSVVERSQLYEVLRRKGLPVDDPDALIAEIVRLRTIMLGGKHV